MLVDQTQDQTMISASKIQFNSENTHVHSVPRIVALVSARVSMIACAIACGLMKAMMVFTPTQA